MYGSRCRHYVLFQWSVSIDPELADIVMRCVPNTVCVCVCVCMCVCVCVCVLGGLL